MAGQTIAVTGANGFLASWVVKLLLERGYNVRGTVRDPDDMVKVGHLLELPGAKDRLVLYKANLLEEKAFDAILDGCDGVFHTAAPTTPHAVPNPEKDLLLPIWKGTMNVVTAASRSKSVKRIVLTSSGYSVLCNDTGFNPRDPNLVIDESWWSDEEWCKKNEMWYALGKTQAERAAWEFAKEKNLDLVVIIPFYMIGPILQNTLNASSEYILTFVDGTRKVYPNRIHGVVHVKDVAMAHILAFENPSAQGRYMLAGESLHAKKLTEILKSLYPNAPVTDKCEDNGTPAAVTYCVDKIKKLGLAFTPVEEALKDCVESLKAKNWLKH